MGFKHIRYVNCMLGRSVESRSGTWGRKINWKKWIGKAQITHRSALVHRVLVQMVDAKQVAVQVADHITSWSNISSHSTFDLHKFNWSHNNTRVENLVTLLTGNWHFNIESSTGLSPRGSITLGGKSGDMGNRNVWSTSAHSFIAPICTINRVWKVKILCMWLNNPKHLIEDYLWSIHVLLQNYNVLQ